ncbi:MAG: hypothetical protein HUJ65_06715, partial [Oscillospiraceae bacterium]|nr:hypothetical protein [Oscillospiraceae bacterium]
IIGINAARARQHERYGDTILANAHADHNAVEKYCVLDAECERLMKGAYESLNLTVRSYDRILRVARTIADLDGAENITAVHLAEAIQYRSFDIKKI